MRLYGEAAEASGKQKEVSDHYGEGPPVPIPNTEVKLAGAEDTWLEAAWENRALPTFFYLCRIKDADVSCS